MIFKILFRARKLISSKIAKTISVFIWKVDCIEKYCTPALIKYKDKNNATELNTKFDSLKVN